MKKKLCALVVSVCLAVGPCSVVSVTAEREQSIQPRAQQCGNCGKMTLNNYTTYGEWVLIGQQRCNKVWNLSDNIYERKVTKGYRCFQCGYDYVYSVSTERKVVCGHS